MNLKINPKVWTGLILISIGAIVCASYLMVNEISDARKECNNLGGEHSFKIVQGHFCDERSFVKLHSCFGQQCNLTWVFEDSIGIVNLSNIQSNPYYIKGFEEFISNQS